MTVLVNEQKSKRAQKILALVNGDLAPITKNDEERKAHFTRILAAGEVDPKGKEAHLFLYKKLGGLVRTEEEHKEAEKKKAEAKKKSKTDKLGLRK